MAGMKPIFDLAEQQIKSLEDAKENGDDLIAQTYLRSLRHILELIEQAGYDEKYAAQVEAIREAVKH